MFYDKQEFDLNVIEYIQLDFFDQNEQNNENIHNEILHLNHLLYHAKLLPNVQMNNINLYYLLMIIYNNIMQNLNKNDVYDQINNANEIHVLKITKINLHFLSSIQIQWETEVFLITRAQQAAKFSNSDKNRIHRGLFSVITV